MLLPAMQLEGIKPPPLISCRRPSTTSCSSEDETPGTCQPSSKLRGRRVKSIPGIWACEELRRCQVLMRRRVA